MMTNHITNTYLTYQINLPSLWSFPACWLSLCEEIVEDLDMACGHGNLLTLGCCTSWHQLAPAGPRWVKQPIKTLMHQLPFACPLPFMCHPTCTPSPFACTWGHSITHHWLPYAPPLQCAHPSVHVQLPHLSCTLPHSHALCAHAGAPQ